MPAKHISDGNPDGQVLGQSPFDLVAFFGAAPICRPNIATLPANSSPAAVIAAVQNIQAALSALGLLGAAIGQETAYGSSVVPVVNELLVPVAGASVTTGLQIMPGSILLGCAARTVAGIAGATSYAVGVAGNLTQFGDLLSIMKDAANPGIIGPTAIYSQTPVIVTPRGGNFTGGSVRLALMTLQVTPPTS